MELIEAVRGMAETLGDPMTAGDVGPRFTCTEADSIARVLAVAGFQDAAATWLFGHSMEDSPLDEDPHAEMTEESVAEYVANNLAL